MTLVLEPNLCLIFCRARAAEVTPARLRRVLSSTGSGLRVTGSAFPLSVRGEANHLHKLNFLWNEAEWRARVDEPESVEKSIT